MYVLAIDASVTGCSVSIVDVKTKNASHRRVETERGQAELLIPMIGEVADECGISLCQLDMIAVTRGPGSFTGVRIGLATARNLGLALDIPVVGVSTLDVMARSVQDHQQTLVLIDTKRGDFYGQVGFGTSPRIWTVEEVEEYGQDILKDIIPDMNVLIEMAVNSYSGGAGYDPQMAPQPLYLRDAEVSQPKNPPPNLF